MTIDGPAACLEALVQAADPAAGYDRPCSRFADPFIAPSLDITASFRVWDVDGHLVETGASQLCCVPAPT